MVVIVGLFKMKKMKCYSVLSLLKSVWIIYLGVLFIALFCNLEKVQSQTVPLDYDLPENGVSIPMPSSDEFNENNHNSNYSDGYNGNGENLDDPIMIFVPPPDHNEEENINNPRKSLADILIIEEMLIPIFK
jgi:hypothetical protein